MTRRIHLGVGIAAATAMAAVAACGSDDEVDCASLAGTWVVASFDCGGATLPTIGLTIEQTFGADCNGSAITSSSTCDETLAFSITVTGNVLEFDPGAVTCGPTCGAMDCTATSDSGAPLSGDISRDDDELTVSFTVTQAIIDSGLTPCDVGDIHTSTLRKK